MQTHGGDDVQSPTWLQLNPPPDKLLQADERPCQRFAQLHHTWQEVTEAAE